MVDDGSFPPRIYLTQFAIAATATTIAVSEWLSDGIDVKVTIQWIESTAVFGIIGAILGGLTHIVLRHEYDEQSQWQPSLVACALGSVLGVAIGTACQNLWMLAGLIAGGPFAAITLSIFNSKAPMLYARIHWWLIAVTIIALNRLTSIQYAHRVH